MFICTRITDKRTQQPHTGNVVLLRVFLNQRLVRKRRPAERRVFHSRASRRPSGIAHLEGSGERPRPASMPPCCAIWQRGGRRRPRVPAPFRMVAEPDSRASPVPISQLHTTCHYHTSITAPTTSPTAKQATVTVSPALTDTRGHLMNLTARMRLNAVVTWIGEVSSSDNAPSGVHFPPPPRGPVSVADVL